MSLWEHRRQNPELSLVFNSWLREQTAATAKAILAAYDFAAARVVADVGGGQGGLLSAILQAHAHLHGILLDRPHVVPEAEAALQHAGVAARCRTIGGDFFTALPNDADLYVLKSVLHDWEDASCGDLLRTCRAAMPLEARLLIIERVLPEQAESAPATVMLDLRMLAVLGGRERSAAQYRNLGSAAGFELLRILPTEAGLQIMEFRPA